jgi:hypothetical protein
MGNHRPRFTDKRQLFQLSDLFGEFLIFSFYQFDFSMQTLAFFNRIQLVLPILT